MKFIFFKKQKNVFKFKFYSNLCKVFFFHMMVFVRVCVEDKFMLIVHMNKGF